MDTILRVIFGLLLITSCMLSTARAQKVPMNVTVAPVLATFTGGWECSLPDGQPIDTGACPTGCRATRVGDTMRMAFEGSVAWLTVQQDLASSVVLSVQLDEAQTYLATRRDDGTSGCFSDVLIGSNLDPTKLHFVSITIIAAETGEAFIFGGLTVTINQADKTALSPSTDDNVSGQTSVTPTAERTAVIIGVLGGVIAFWLLAGLAIWHVRRVRHATMKHPFHVPEIMSVDKFGAGADSQATMVNRSIGVDSAATLVTARDKDAMLQRSLVGTTRTTSSASSYPATVDVPLPASFPVIVPSVPPLPATLTIETGARSLNNHFSGTLVESSPEMTKWERELRRTAKEEGGARVTGPTWMEEPVGSRGEFGGAKSQFALMSADEFSASSSAAPPLYELNSVQYANGLQRRWV